MSNSTIQVQPFYDPNRTYQENWDEGPFGDFANNVEYKDQGEPEYELFGHKLYLPFGIPAGPLLTFKFCESAFKKGFDIAVYKTIRPYSHPCNAFPNVVPVKVDGKLTLEQAKKGLVMDDDYHEPIAITNSFGVPSPQPEVWQADMKRAVQSARKGQLLIGSYQATNKGEGEEVFIADWVKGAKMVKETGAKVIEFNLSCPNEGNSQLLCHDTDQVVKITQAVRKEIKNTPMLVKISYFSSNEKLFDFVQKTSSYVSGYATINTIAGAVRKADGTQALPGEGRLVSGVCGAPTKWAGLEMVGRLNEIRAELNLDFKIIGTGGVTTPEDYKQYRAAGADAVMSATGAMWNTDLAKEIKGLELS